MFGDEDSISRSDEDVKQNICLFDEILTERRGIAEDISVIYL